MLNSVQRGQDGVEDIFIDHGVLFIQLSGAEKNIFVTQFGFGYYTNEQMIAAEHVPATKKSNTHTNRKGLGG